MKSVIYESGFHTLSERAKGALHPISCLRLVFVQGHGDTPGKFELVDGKARDGGSGCVVRALVRRDRPDSSAISRIGAGGQS